jgi:hypothetical protein
MTFTIDQILGWKPCKDYTRKRIEELFSGRESITAEELAELDIPIEEKIWFFLQSEHAPEIVERIVTRAVTNHALTCGIPEVEAWAGRWMDGTDRSRESAVAAEAATWATADAAWATEAATLATADAAWAAEAAATRATWAAVARATLSATLSATLVWMEERELQLVDCLAVMRKGGTE